jgi:predicted nucleic-acid-binding Zn-ribbon protein
MQETAHTATPQRGEGILIGTGGGIKATLGFDGHELTAYVCSECGLVRFYAE